VSKDNNKLIDYDSLVDNALRGVVKTVLKLLESKENIGDHHFFITFITNHKNVDIPKSFNEIHPNTMTIVLQHQFWDLIVDDDYFSVTLSFNGKQEKLSIGYDAITQFTDPSTDFVLQFASNEIVSANEKDSKDETKDISDLKEITEDKTKDQKNQNQTKPDSQSKGEVISFDKFKKKK
tara:strand:+ start:210 stop:746 length:537 start_codon:yes stop_codon:yes gene_type:complete